MATLMAFFGFLFVLGAGCLVLILPILALTHSRRALRHMEQLQGAVRELEHQVQALKREAAIGRRPFASSAAPSSPAPPLPPSHLPTARIPVEVPPDAPGVSQAPAPETLESRIGGHWMLFVGAAALVLGVGFFVKYAFENHWITETARVAVGALVGILLIGAGHRFSRRGFQLYGQVLSGSGFLALYIAIYAAANFYALVLPGVAFVLFVAVTLAAAMMADRQRSRAMAMMAVAGGFLVPFLVSTGRDAHLFLFSYDAVLIGGTAFLARRGGWPLLNAASFGLTVLTLVLWSARFYTPEKYVTTELFLTVYCAMFLYILRATSHRGGESAWNAVLSTAPVLYHAASIVILFDHSLAFLLYLVALSGLGLAFARHYQVDGLRLVVWIATVPVFLGWLTGHVNPQWLIAASTVAVTLYGMHLAALVDRIVHVDEPVPAPDVVALHLNALGLFASGYLLTDGLYPDFTGATTLALAIWHAGLFRVFRGRAPEVAINTLALAFTFVAIALGLQLEGRWLTVAWAAEGGAVVWAGLASRREWIRFGGLLLMVLAIDRLLVGFFETPAGFAPIANPRMGATLFVVAALYGVAWTHRRLGAHLAKSRDGVVMALILIANALTVLLLSAEIHSFWEVRKDLPTAYLARGVMLSLTWALYAVALIGIGIRYRYAPIRYLAILLFGITVAKVFLVDLSELGGLYRVAGFVAFGGVLLLASFLYQRYRGLIAPR